MTFPPGRVGDKGQRYQVEYTTKSDPEVWRVFGWAGSRQGARHMAKVWHKHPCTQATRIIDRHKEPEKCKG